MVSVTLQTTLTEGDAEAWRALCATHTDYASPLLGPDFARLVAGIRPDVRHWLVHEGDTLVAAMAVHLRPGGLARPAGAPFADTAGPVLAPGFVPDLPDLIRRAGLAAYRADAVADPHGVLEGPGIEEGEASWLIQPGERAPDDYLEACRAANPKRMKNFRRLMRRLDEAHGPIALVHGPPEPVALSNLLAWKSAQFRETGKLDVVSAANSARVLNATARASGPGAEGFMVALMAEGRLYAGHFGVRSGRHFHPWISAYDTSLAEYGPGVLLLKQVIEHMGDMGLDSYSLAGGHDHYKKYFALDTRPTRRVNITGAGPGGRFQAATAGLWNSIGARRETSLAGRLQRRLDHIAVCEPTTTGRIAAFVDALKNRG
jgi:CelD/BcsL family acetyltransferase involved in cellulose biosynthesis